MITERLRDFRWASETATPLTLALGDLSLSPEERVSGREALAWLEKRPRPTHTLERAFNLIDTDELSQEARAELRNTVPVPEDGEPIDTDEQPQEARPELRPAGHCWGSWRISL